MLRQQTLKEAAHLEGTGLHSGNAVRMRFLPAAPNTGIRFRRVDLEGQPEIEARVEHVSDTTRSTTLSRGNVRIHTVEHVLATFAGYGITNAVVELDANEPPIGDGSARAYCGMIQGAGIHTQTESLEPHRPSSPIEVTQGDAIMAAFPHDRFQLTCTSTDKRGRFTQFHSLELSPETWERELSDARTFCFFEEIEPLIRNGLIRGGTLENAVVIRDDAVLTTEPLRYADEFVRHKMLDILGDLALVGRPLQAHVIALRPSHSANCELARLLATQIRKPVPAAQPFVPPSAPEAVSGLRAAPMPAVGPTLFDIDRVMGLLPHRYPFLMVDRVLRMEGRQVSAIKNVTINEPYFEGHFPNHPLMPGVLQLEAMAQVAGLLLMQEPENIGKIAYFMSADKVKWRKPVRPGDTLLIEIEMTKARGKIGKAKGTCSVAGDVVSEAEVTFTLVDT